MALTELFGVPRALIGMVHLGALPGTPRAGPSLPEIVATAVAETICYAESGYHAVILENMHDRPYLAAGVGPEVVAAMAVVCAEVRRQVDLPVGIQVLAAANREALAVALAGGAAFIRAEAFIFSHVADEGWLDGQAGELLRYRRAIGADHIKIFADIKKKHSAHAVTADVDLAETARAAEFFLADGLVVTGTATGSATDPAEVQAVCQATSLPVLVGSGLTPDNLASFAPASGLIVGSWVKEQGHWSNPLDPLRVKAMAGAFRA